MPGRKCQHPCGGTYGNGFKAARNSKHKKTDPGRRADKNHGLDSSPVLPVTGDRSDNPSCQDLFRDGLCPFFIFLPDSPYPIQDFYTESNPEDTDQNRRDTGRYPNREDTGKRRQSTGCLEVHHEGHHNKCHRKGTCAKVQDYKIIVTLQLNTKQLEGRLGHHSFSPFYRYVVIMGIKTMKLRYM